MQIQFYKANGHDRTLAPKDLAKLRISADSLLWINGTSAEIAALPLPEALADAFAMHDPAMETVRVHDSFYTLSIPVLSFPGEESSGALSLIVGQDWLLSVGEGVATDFEAFIDHDVGETMKGKLSGSTLAVALIADHFGRVHHRIASINREIDRMEERVLTGREGRNTLQVMAVLRRQVSRLRELIDSLRGTVHALTRPDFLPEMAGEDRAHFMHLQAGFERLEDEVARVRDTVVASFDLYATRVAQDTNRLVRTLTFFTIGIGLVGALAGVFGMNFKVALFEKGEQGFFLAAWIMAGILIVTAAVALVSYRRP
ncbi:magnesium transporter CorA family protein [Novosphingobium aquiterrae]|uniref:Magnesium transporter CorA family protein n=1 Tax=Novosphingobium aquiterrae TaxID=624388 RepID=A0ABV6PH87_9SPHN